ncbi:MAG TPA: hypothetical protein VNQ81_16455 [Povalibacter sp.]|nr:hypothetical protein [Povalibacter sp.]
MSNRSLHMLIVALAAAAAAGCATTGTGAGNLRGGDVKAQFSWESSGDRTGTMTATLSTGQVYSGQFFQITHDSRIETLGPLWYGWSDGWRGWRYWGPHPDMAFVTHYTGRVVANLQDADGEHTRCHFQLVHPQRGMSGGGEGQCQLPSGQTIDATFPHA